MERAIRNLRSKSANVADTKESSGVVLTSTNKTSVEWGSKVSPEQTLEAGPMLGRASATERTEGH